MLSPRGRRLTTAIDPDPRQWEGKRRGSNRFGPPLCRTVVLWGWVLANLCLDQAALAKEFDSNEPPLLATSSQLLLMEQVEELIATGEQAEAILNLEKLFDQAGGSIVRQGGVQQAATLQTQRYVPLRRWTQQRLGELLLAQPAIKSLYQAKLSDNARAKLVELRASKDVIEAQKAGLRFSASQLGPEFCLLLSDLYLEKGWSVAAVQAAQDASADLRVTLSAENLRPVDAPSNGSGFDTLPWTLAWRNVDSSLPRDELVRSFQSLLDGDTISGTSRRALLFEATQRIILAAAISPELLDQPAALQWAGMVAESLDEQSGLQLNQLIDKARSWPALENDVGEWPTFAGDSARQRIGRLTPKSIRSYDWAQSDIERFYAFNDRTTASKPRVAETETGTLPYFPVVSGGRVYVNSLTSILAYDLSSGKPWPDIQPALPLFDSQISPAAYIPRGYSSVGTPRATLSVVEHCLYARMGSPITGWAGDNGAADGNSRSFLVGLDLERQGSLLNGFPLRLLAPEFLNAEFDGAPLVWGNMLMAPIVERDNVGLRRSVAAFDRFSGELRWRSQALAQGIVEGTDRANLISHQLLAAAGGRLFYNTNLGTIVCLDPLNGRVEWLTRYTRYMTRDQTYPKPDRFRYRDLTPCMVHRGLVYCAPQDCPEIFALDATTGDLVWSTDDEQVADAIHVLGVYDDSLVVSGDRLIWLDRLSGRVLSRFPGSTTPGVVNALPSPRGLGRGAITGGKVFWPTSDEMFVFPASVEPVGDVAAPITVPAIQSRIRIDARGKEGGNIIVAGDWLLFCTPNRLMAFHAAKPTNQVGRSEPRQPWPPSSSRVALTFAKQFQPRK